MLRRISAFILFAMFILVSIPFASLAEARERDDVKAYGETQTGETRKPNLDGAYCIGDGKLNAEEGSSEESSPRERSRAIARVRSAT